MIETLHLQELLHIVSQGLLYPTIIILLVLIVYALWCIGSIITEAICERRHYQVAMPELIAALDGAAYHELPDVIDASGLLRSQKSLLKTLVFYGYLPEEARIALAKRLLADQEYRYSKVSSRTDIVAKIAPMFGLMGTLIPLGPGIVSLGQGQTEQLASSIEIAFDTTIAGLVVAAIALMVSRFRKRWYEDYLVTLETAFATILEKAAVCKQRGEKIGDAKSAAALSAQRKGCTGGKGRAGRKGLARPELRVRRKEREKRTGNTDDAGRKGLARHELRARRKEREKRADNTDNAGRKEHERSTGRDGSGGSNCRMDDSNSFDERLKGETVTQNHAHSQDSSVSDDATSVVAAPGSAADLDAGEEISKEVR